ncbi:bifunctional copper resistance protein CopD/cytochrome c oxidase assembly protein [Actinotalea subterranea]|uniref:bifunctional copper resistance protein CopD/cytochrome c oxidase assembly protein n=1 Tax=Actinotalea subterranea TaxID=2607497 RepID=UPI0011EC8CD2|nr:bifunctional copper resistance protein CopD/cytochrome c oxidase assembly protein [Actinotalea subterranea]
MPQPAPVALARLSRTGVVAGVVAALGVGASALLFSGAAAPGGLVDPGAVVRWGYPASRVLSELATAVTLGALLLAAAVLPRTGGRAKADGAAWPATVVVAAFASGAWAVASVAHLVLSYGYVSGRPIGGPTFGSELGLYVGQVSIGRTYLAVTVVAALTCVLTLLVTGPRGALLTGLFATSALVMQSTTGHASGASNHELAVSSMFLHLMGAALWIGALAALALVAHRLGRDLGPSVARYSAVAGWCFVAVGVSGAVNAAGRLGSLDDLGTTYGLLVVAKIALLGMLGLLGWAHRRAVIPALAGAHAAPRGRATAARAGTPASGSSGAGSPRVNARVGDGASARAPWLFWRLVLVELAVMGAVSGVAVALGSAEPPVPEVASGDLTAAEIVTGHPLPPAPTAELWLTAFRWDLIPALGCLAGAIVYLRWVRRLRLRGDRWPVGRTLSWLAGMVLLAWTTSGGPAVYGHVLFSAHMLQHMVLVMIVPILIALSGPVTLGARALPARTDGSRGPREWLLGVVHSTWAGFFANPIVAAVNFAGSMFVFYFSDAFELALTTYLGHIAMVAHFTLAGYLFVNALVGIDPGPRRPGYPLRLLLLFATMAFHAFFGLAIVSSEMLLVPEWFGLLGRPWGESALDDQRTGGAIAWGISELPMLALAIAVAVSWTRDDERTARRRDRAADRDGDAELAEYNAMLEKIARRDG